MKQIVLFLLAVCLAFQVEAQNQTSVKELNHYTFPDFMEGTVKKKTGETIKTLLNYNTITQEMIFQQSGKYLALDEIESIDSVNLQGKTFVPANRVF